MVAWLAPLLTWTTSTNQALGIWQTQQTASAVSMPQIGSNAQWLQSALQQQQQLLILQQFGLLDSTGLWGSGQQLRPAQPVYQAPRPAIIRERTPEEVVEREAAIARARGLLIGELSRAQRRQFDAEGSFEVRGRRGVYRIRRAVAGNIDVLRPEGGIAHRLCGHPSDLSMPVEDVMLAQLIHLRHDEDGFLRIANRHAAPGIHPGVDAHLAMAERRLAA